MRAISSNYHAYTNIVHGAILLHSHVVWNQQQKKFRIQENVELDMKAESGITKKLKENYEIHPFGKHSFEIENFMANLFYLLLLC